MTERDPLLQCFADATEPRPEALARARSVVMTRAVAPRGTRHLLRHLPAASPQAIERVRRRVLGRPEAQPLRPFLWAAGALWAGGAVAMAAVALVVGVSMSWTAPVAEPELLVPVASIALESPDEWSSQQLATGVSARLMGSGTLRGTGPDIAWHDGTLELSVDPEEHRKVTIETQEADIRVIGTVLTVDRGALGTRVSVAHGIVEVVCSGQLPDHVAGGQHRLCLPITAAGMLGRAQALEVGGAPSEDVLEAVASGLDIADGPIQGELRAFRIQHLLQVGRSAEALDFVDDYLQSGTVLRRTQILRAGVRLALDLHGCERALPYLEALATEDPAEADSATLKRCSKKRNRGR